MPLVRRLLNSSSLSKFRRNFYSVLIIAGLIWFIIWNGSRHVERRKNLEGIVKNYEKEITKLKLQNTQMYSALTRFHIPRSLYTFERLPIIHVITPTYKRPEQEAELTRLKTVFLHVPELHWILVEDSYKKSAMVAAFLKNSHLNYTHLNIETPVDMKLNDKDPRWKKPRGVLQRNLGLKWVRANVNRRTMDVVYFADDDNTYSIELFSEMRPTLFASVWPVGLSGGSLVERPLVGLAKDVVGWDVAWAPDRKFATDMAGFCIAVDVLHRYPDVEFRMDTKIGLLETDFLERLLYLRDLEAKADNCTKVLVWHTQTKEFRKHRKRH